MITVAYYMIGKPKQFAQFETFDEARAFMQRLNDNPSCESYNIFRAR